jgi:hypothetical protein
MSELARHSHDALLGGGVDHRKALATSADHPSSADKMLDLPLT